MTAAKSTTTSKSTKKMTEAQQLQWDNDPYALPHTAKTAAYKNFMVFKTMRDRGEKPADLKNKTLAKQYGEWLKANPAPTESK